MTSPATLRQTFPKSVVQVVCPTGTVLHESAPGLDVEIKFRDPRHAVAVLNGSDCLGLTFGPGHELEDYDGAFFLPREVGHMLRQAGYLVGNDCFA